MSQQNLRHKKSKHTQASRNISTKGKITKKKSHKQGKDITVQIISNKETMTIKVCQSRKRPGNSAQFVAK